MRNARLRGRDRADLARSKVNAVTEHGSRREHAAFLVNIRVVARRHKKMVHFFEFLSIFGEMRLEISLESRGQFGGTAHHFFRAGHSETRAKSIFEPAFLGAMPFPAKPLAFHQ